MLRIYGELLSLCGDVRGLVEGIERKDGDLGRQVRRSLASVVPNVAEGSGSSGGNRRLRYASALGSLRESLAAFEFAAVMGYVGPLSAGLRARFDRGIGTLVRVAK